MPQFPSGLSLILEATSPFPPTPAGRPALQFHEKAASARVTPQPQRIADAAPVAASSPTGSMSVHCWNSRAFVRQLEDVRNGGNYREVSEQHGYAPLSVEYEALRDAAQRGALVAVRNGMSCPEAASSFHFSCNPEDVEALMVAAAMDVGRTQLRCEEPLNLVLHRLGISPGSQAGLILKNLV